MDLEALALHLDGTVGIMYRDGGELACTCGWPDAEGENTRQLWAKVETTWCLGPSTRSEEPERDA